MILLDLSHTCHTAARTGIQRVARSLAREFAAAGTGEAVTWDPHEARWRALEPWERKNLEDDGTPPSSRSARWPLAARLRGRLRRLTRRGAPLPSAPGGGALPAGLLLPELFAPAVFNNLIHLRAAVPGPAAAIFHDAIALRRPALFPRGTVARFPSYLAELATLDGVAAVSEDSRQALLDYWAWLGLDDTPPVATISPGLDAPRPPASDGGSVAGRGAGAAPLLLCVSTIEGRKNHLALLEACEALWSVGHGFSLELAGLARPDTAAAALARARQLAAAGRPVKLLGPLSEEALEAAYSRCDLTVYPSLEEGYGLPVAESLARGKPCLCSGRGALGELSRGGGCLTLGGLDAGNIAASLGFLLRSPELLARLRTEAAQRRFPSWKESAAQLGGWLASLRVRR